MSFRAATLTGLFAAMLAVFAPVALAATPGPQTGRYKATTSAGTPFEFRVVKATCPPPVRGGNQHQKKASASRRSPTRRSTSNVLTALNTMS